LREAQGGSRASLVQALRRGDATTAEFRGDRLDIIIDPKTNAVIGLRCAEPPPSSLASGSNQTLGARQAVSQKAKPAVIFAPDFCNA
jgi:hypothetical protein